MGQPRQLRAAGRAAVCLTDRRLRTLQSQTWLSPWMSGAPGCLSRTAQGAVPSAAQQLHLVMLRPRRETFCLLLVKSLIKTVSRSLLRRVILRGNRAISVL